MNFKCYFCHQLFDDVNKIIRHLKYTHNIKDKCDQIKCVVNFKSTSGCRKHFQTFSGLRNHLKKCLIINLYHSVVHMRKMNALTQFDASNLKI